MMALKRVAAAALMAGLISTYPQPAAPIIDGTLDFGYECVGALHHSTQGFLCTGTLIDESWVLTSASCAALGPELFAMGADWLDSPRVFAVEYAVLHPSYDGSEYDFALLHLRTPASGESTCAPLTPPDNLFQGMEVMSVGYGLTSYPSGYTSARHRTTNSVSTVYALHFGYDIFPSGPCIGDQGGPNLVLGTTAVVGVISTTDETCSGFGISGRVAQVTNSFIVPTIADPPGIFFDGFESGDMSAW